MGSGSLGVEVGTPPTGQLAKPRARCRQHAPYKQINSLSDGPEPPTVPAATRSALPQSRPEFRVQSAADVVKAGQVCAISSLSHHINIPTLSAGQLSRRPPKRTETQAGASQTLVTRISWLGRRALHRSGLELALSHCRE